MTGSANRTEASRLPNALTLARLALAPAVAALILAGWPAAAFALFLLAALLDFADGRVARAMDSETTLGAVLDPVADKLLAAFGLVALALRLDLLAGWMLVPAFAIIGRDIVVAGLRDYAARSGAALGVSALAKTKTFLELAALAALLGALAARDVFAPGSVMALYAGGWLGLVGLAALWLAAALSAVTGARYAASLMRRAG